MKNTKYRLLDAYLYDYPYIQKQLCDQAARGWHLEKVSNFLCKFRRGEPKQVRYEVTYSPAASAFNSRPTEEEEDLADLCAQAGWVRVASSAQLQIFRNEAPNATPLETDEGQRLDNIRRTMRKHFFPQNILIVVLFLLQFLMHGSTALRHPSRTLSSPLMFTTLTMFPLVIAMYLTLIFNSLLWLRRAQSAVDAGRELPANTFYRRFRWVIWSGLIAYLWSLFNLAGMTYAGMILGISAITITCTYGAISLCKSMNTPKWVTILVSMGTTMAMMMFLMTIFTTSMDRTSMTEEPPHPDELPLMLSELTDLTNTERTILEENSSPLAAYGRYWDQAEEERLTYTIVDVKCPLFYDMILNEQEQQFMQSASWPSYGEVILNQGDLWGAHYARRASGEDSDRWLICWDDRVVSLKASWPLTDEQIAIASEILNP